MTNQITFHAHRTGRGARVTKVFSRRGSWAEICGDVILLFVIRGVGAATRRDLSVRDSESLSFG